MDRLSRPAAWNLFLAVLVLSSALAVRLTGTPWSTIGAVLGGGLVLGTVLALVVAPLSRRRLDCPPALRAGTAQDRRDNQRAADLSRLAGIAKATRRAA